MKSIHAEYQRRMLMAEEEEDLVNDNTDMNVKITCLGKEFNSEEERREYFRNELRIKLPELKKNRRLPYWGR